MKTAAIKIPNADRAIFMIGMSKEDLEHVGHGDAHWHINITTAAIVLRNVPIVDMLVMQADTEEEMVAKFKAEMKGITGKDIEPQVYHAKDLGL